MMRNFWWGQREKERKLAWIAWEKMCTPKAEDGMGCKDLKVFNLALLAKRGWRISQDANSLAHRECLKLNTSRIPTSWRLN